MPSTIVPTILSESHTLVSSHLGRAVVLDFFLPQKIDDPSTLSLLLINDGQNMRDLGFLDIVENLYAARAITPMLCVGIHAAADRKMEYGVAAQADYEGRGAKAGLYTSFILHELLPFISGTLKINSFKEKAFAGFSLGALTALDIVWNNPHHFSKAGLFSGSFWWRSIDQTDPSYNDDSHRIMHQVIRKGQFHRGLQFFFQCGNMDEVQDRNNNGIIDSIDDTQDIIKELVAKGYDFQKDIHYLEMPDGKHDVATWAKAMPEFLLWGWGNERKR